MRTIVHLSDLHFGADAPVVVDAVRDAVHELAPDVVAVSGDLTQRARGAQFAAARRFLDSLPFPKVVVPGNHDVPLYNVYRRLVRPRAGFNRHVTDVRFPVYADDEVAVVGADTTRSITVKDGGLARAEVDSVAALLAATPSAVRVVVCHHPFDPPAGLAARWTRPGSDSEAIDRLVQRGVDVFLTGHLHVSYMGHTAVRYRTAGRSAIVVEAGTATSVRARGEQNSFNLLRVDGPLISVERLEWSAGDGRFLRVHREQFQRREEGWMPVTAAVDGG